MVPEGSHVRSVYLSEGTGVLASSIGNKILIDCSTIDTGTSLAVRDACASQHPEARFYDAPVSGGAIGAEKGTLTFMLGCTPDGPARRVGRPADVAAAVLLALTNPFITGSTLHVDGGGRQAR